MASTPSSSKSVTAHISKVEITEDTLTGRGGLALFSRYVRNTGIFPHLERRFGPLRKNGKGPSVSELFHQLFCFLADGTSRHLVHFDKLKEDEGYARGIETDPERMASSHAIKRFFASFAWGRIWNFRWLLLELFLWRLKVERPEVIVLGLDTMVMDNDEARARQGCQPTYKKVKGFQPLQLTWGPFVIDALFRGGKKNGNAAFYYTVLVAFCLFEAFKQDVTAAVVPITAQATRARRETIDFAAKIVRHSGQTILKVTAAIWNRLRLPELWERAARPPRLAPT